MAHHGVCVARSGLKRGASLIALLSLAALFSACLPQPQSTFVRSAPVPADLLFT